MALPTYKRQVGTVAKPKQIASGGNAAAGVMASAQAKQSLSQKLSAFSSQTKQMAGSMAAQQASKDAVRDVHTRKQKIADINNNPNLTNEERIEQVGQVSEGTQRAFSGVYSKAYESTATAAYSNQITVDTKLASDQAMIKAGGDSSIYAKQMAAFREETIPNAPSPETAIVAEMAITQYGSSGYKSLKMAEIRKDEQRRHQSSNDTINLQASDSQANMQEGDFVNASQNLFKLQETLKDSVANGWETKESAQKIMDKSTERGVLDYAKDRFSTGEPIEAQEFINKFREGSVDGEIPTEFFDIDREKVADRMEYLLDTEIKKRDATAKAQQKENVENANLMIGDGITIIKHGKVPDNFDEMLEALPYASAKKQHDFKIQVKAAEVSRPYQTLSLPEQLATVTAMEADDTASIEDIEVLATIKANLKEKQALAKKDMITLGAQDGLYEPTKPITPGINPEVGVAILAERTRQAGVSKEKYGTPMQVFTEAEVTQWNTWINDRGTSIQDKMGFIASVEEGTNGKGYMAYAQLMKDKRANVFTAAGDFYAEGRPETSQMLLHGEMVLNSEMGASIDRKSLTGVLNTKIGNALARSTKQDKDKVISAVTAYYASLAEGYGALGDESYKYADQAVEEVLGKSGIRNGQGYFAPQGLDSDDVDDFMDDLDPANLEPIQGIPADMTKNTIERSKLVQVQGSEYRLIFQNHAVTKEDGTPYTIKIIK